MASQVMVYTKNGQFKVKVVNVSKTRKGLKIWRNGGVMLTIPLDKIQELIENQEKSNGRD